jgi:catabolite regulation protein CreA
MQKHILLPFLMGALSLSVTVTAADIEKTIDQKNACADYAKRLKEVVDGTNKRCGSSLTASYDKSTYREFDPMKDRTQTACQSAISQLGDVCISDAGKAAAKGISRATCRFSTTGTGIVVEGSTLIIKIDPANSSITGKQAGSYSWASAIKENM